MTQLLPCALPILKIELFISIIFSIVPGMKTNGKTLRAIQEKLGVTPVEVCAEANVSIATLYNVYAGKRVSANSVNRVKKAFNTLRFKSKAAG